jgi:hypothetical protein
VMKSGVGGSVQESKSRYSTSLSAVHILDPGAEVRNGV